MKAMRSHNAYKYLFFATVLFYGLVLGRLGFENWDTGYIPSFSWRIVNGSHAYADFVYKGPPATLYFHALFMEILPETGQFFFIRIVNYLLFALQVYCIATGFDKLYDLTGKGFNKWGLMCVGFVVSILNFPCYPWPTTDGLLFAALAFYLVSLKKFGFARLFAIAACCLLSALTKQSFYLVPFAFLVWIYLESGFRKTLLFLGCLLFLFAAFLFFISQITTIDNFLAQTTGETHFKDLIGVGFIQYVDLFRNIYVVFGLLAFTVALAFFRSGKNGKVYGILKWFPVALFMVAMLASIYKEILVGSRIAFVAAVVALAYRFRFRKETITHLAPIAVALCIAWSCAVSFGYAYPIFFTTGILGCFLVLMHTEIRQLMVPKFYAIAAFPVVLAALSYAYRPYRDMTIPNLAYSLDAVSPKLAYIQTNRENLEKHLELKKLVSFYGDHFIVAPAMPMAHYLFNTNSQLPADWLINTEVGRQYDLFLTLASDKRNYVFLEKSFLEGEEMASAEQTESSIIAWNIHQKFRRVAETKYFIVYNSLK